jgi:predicted Zn-dependent protease
MAQSMESDLHLGQIAVRMGLIQAQDLPQLIQEARVGHVEESAGSSSAFAQMLLRKQILSVSDYLYMADQARQEKPEVQAPLRELETAFKSYESGELDLGSFEDIVRSTSGEPIRRPKESVQYFGKYLLMEEVARGGMGIVYKTKDPRDGRIVALKVMIEADDDEVRLARFEREAELCGSLTHANVVRVFDAGRVEGMPYFTMDLVDGESLDDMLEGDGIPRDLAIKAIAQAARAMHHAHERGIIHRDLKPGNILIERKTGNAKVTDFGLARDLYRGTRLTQVGQAVGTPYYMAPEQVRGERNVDGRCDIYALGVILYEILTGDIPFDADSPLSLFRKIDREEIVLPIDDEAGVDVRIHSIAMRALHKDRDQRYHSGDLLAEDLERYLRGEAPRAQPYGWREAIRRRLRGPGRGAALAGLVLSTLVVLGLAAALGVRRLRSAQARADAELKVDGALEQAREARDKALEASGAMQVKGQAEEGLRRLAALEPLREGVGTGAEGAQRRFEEAKGPALLIQLRRLRAQAAVELASQGSDALREAEAAVNALVESEPQEVELRLALAAALAEQGRADEGLRVCAKLIELDASQRAVRITRARLLLELQRGSEAERDLGAILLREPNDLEARVARVAAYLAQGKLDEAKADAERARDLAPREVAGHVAAGDVALARGRRDDALRGYREARQLRPRDALPALRLGELHLVFGSWEAALREFGAAGKLGATIEALRGEARARALLFQLEGASEALSRALAACEEQTPARRARLRAVLLVELGELRLAGDRTADAKASFEAALRDDPHLSRAGVWLARLALVARDAEAARAALKPLARSRRPSLQTERSRLALLLDEHERARTLAEHAVAGTPAGRFAPRAQRALAQAFLAKAQDEVARHACQKAWDEGYKARDLSAALLRRAREWTALRVHYGRDSVNGLAEELLGAALRLDPTRAAAWSLLGQLAAHEKRFVPAWRALDLAAHLDPFHPELAEVACRLALDKQPRQRVVAALEAMTRAARSQPSGERLLLQARCQVELERWEGALESLERTGRLLPARAQVEELRARVLRARNQSTGAELAAQRARELGPEREAQRLRLRTQAAAAKDPAKARDLLDAALRLSDPRRDRDHPELARLKAVHVEDPLERLTVVAPSLLQPRWDLLDRADRLLAPVWDKSLSEAARRKLIERAKRGEAPVLLTLALAALYDGLTGAATPTWFREGLRAASRCVELEPACLPAHLARAALRMRTGDADRALRELLALRHAFGSSALYQFTVAEVAAAAKKPSICADALRRAEARKLVALERRKAASAYLNP